MSFFGQAQGRSSGGLGACPLTSIQSCPCTCRQGLYLDDSGASCQHMPRRAPGWRASSTPRHSMCSKLESL